MANYRITYKDAASVDRTIDLLPGDDGVQLEWQTTLKRNITSTGRYENVIQNSLRFLEIDCYFQESVFHKLETFMSFAQQGQSFTFTKDTDKGTTVDLASDVSAGDSTVVTTVDSDFEAGDFVILRDTEGTKWDVAEVASVATTTITLVEPIQNGYLAGSIINWYFYFDSLILIDKKFNPKQDGGYWNHTFNCVEAR